MNNNQSKEPLMPHEPENLSWAKVATNLFQLVEESRVGPLSSNLKLQKHSITKISHKPSTKTVQSQNKGTTPLTDALLKPIVPKV